MFWDKNCNISQSSVESFAVENTAGVMYCLYGFKFVSLVMFSSLISAKPVNVHPGVLTAYII